jgi:hypothetical protein
MVISYIDRKFGALEDLARGTGVAPESPEKRDSL